MRYRFGPFELKTDTYELLREGQRLAVRPKVFDLLRYLIEHRETLVTKDELLGALWNEQHVEENAVPWTVGHARRAIGQASQHKSPIETIYGRGYRWVAPVEHEELTPPLAQPLEPGLPFVGRAPLLELLQRYLHDAKQGLGRLGLLTGEAGIGKTRCLDELSLRARDVGMQVWSARSLEGVETAVFHPWRTLLRAVAFHGGDERRASHLTRCLSDDHAHAQGTLASDRELGLGRLTVFEEVASFLLDAARQRPALLVLDDLHCADRGSLELLRVIAPELRKARILVVAGARQLPWLGIPQLAELSVFFERFELTALSQRDVHEYMQRWAGVPQPTRALCDAVLDASAGNPLFMQEVLASVAARYGRAALTDLSAEHISPGIRAQDVLKARFAALPDHVQAVLMHASVFGDRFDPARLSQLVGASATANLEALEVACAAGAIRLDGAVRYRFRHSLPRVAAYESLSGSARASAHRTVAGMLSNAPDAALRRSEIAQHYYLSIALGDYERVAAAAVAAAESAMRAQAFSDAARFYAWAIEAVELTETASSVRRRTELQLARARAQRFSGTLDDARATIVQLVELSEAHGYADLLVQAAKVLRPSHAMGAHDDPLARQALQSALQCTGTLSAVLRAQALSMLACLPPAACDIRTSQQLSAEALSLARESGSREVLGEALTARLYGKSGPDDVPELLALSREMLALDRHTGSWISVEAHVARHAAFNLAFDLDAAAAELAALQTIAKRRGLRDLIWHCERMQAQRELLSGNIAYAATELNRLEREAQRLRMSESLPMCTIQTALLAIARDGLASFPLFHEPGIFDALPHTLIPTSYRANIGRAALAAGQLGPARALLEEFAEKDFDNVPRDLSYLSSLSNLALIAVGLSDRTRAQQLFALLSPYAQLNTPNSMGYCEGAVAHFLALLAESLGNGRAAAELVDVALQRNARLGDGPLLAQTYYESARMRINASDPLGAKHRARALELTDRLGMKCMFERLGAMRG